MLTPSIATDVLSWIENVLVRAPAEAEITAVCAVETELTDAEKDAELAPAGTISEAGSVTAALLL